MTPDTPANCGFKLNKQTPSSTGIDPFFLRKSFHPLFSCYVRYRGALKGTLHVFYNKRVI
ncbi:hypothetical protein XBFFR1_2090028 [Xenorhabdus bovienii str. feltiae France]|nr:hypothetical protein XBFFR1_2090028 [Xenorhabdus bovienii str. feltiae France]